MRTHAQDWYILPVLRFLLYPQKSSKAAQKLATVEDEILTLADRST